MGFGSLDEWLSDIRPPDASSGLSPTKALPLDIRADMRLRGAMPGDRGFGPVEISSRQSCDHAEVEVPAAEGEDDGPGPALLL